jgi:GNAT superfamily N-acetyltransferase
VRIHDAVAADWPAIWPFFEAIVTARETFAYDPEIREPAARELWMVGPPGRTVVAIDEKPGRRERAATPSGGVLGSSNMCANRPGPGSHVASASFMVDEAARGRGVGRALGEDFLDWARGQGYRAAQFNAVVETNTAAVALWRSLGFEVVGTVPDAFRNPQAGYVGMYVGIHVMHRRL